MFCDEASFQLRDAFLLQKPSVVDTIEPVGFRHFVVGMVSSLVALSHCIDCRWTGFTSGAYVEGLSFALGPCYLRIKIVHCCPNIRFAAFPFRHPDLWLTF